MQENVLFPGYLDDVRDFIGLADVGFVLSTDVETISLACREMMAMAKPVLVSDFSGLRENICDDVDGWISAKGDISSIEIKVGLIVAEQNRLGMMGLRAREKAVSDFGADEFARKTADVYRHVCRLNPPS